MTSTITGGTPQFTVMDGERCRDFLVAHSVGRLAYAVHDGVDIQPVNYVFEDGWIYGRTQIGSKLASLAHHPGCAFEVDEVHGLYAWTSVVARGTFELLDPLTGSVSRYDRALELMRELTPGALSAGDPAPNRAILFGILVSSLSGRSASQPPRD